jgi:hypothetical protein
LFKDGLVPAFSCLRKDDRAVRKVETILYYKAGFYPFDSGLQCEDEVVSRIGYMVHWGVRQRCCSYFSSWKDHRSPGDSLDNIVNIRNAVQEFQRRSEADDGAVFLFNSNLWDVYDYVQNAGGMELESWLKEFRASYGDMVDEIASAMRRNDSLVLQLSHHIHPSTHPKAEISKLVNIEIMAVAANRSLPTFRSDLMTGFFHPSENNYLKDSFHQNAETSRTMAEHLRTAILDLRVG